MRYPALRVIVFLHYVLAAFAAAGVFFWARATGRSSLLAGVLALAAPIGIVAAAELIRVLLAIEENTRASRGSVVAAEVEKQVEVPGVGKMSSTELAVTIAAVVVLLALMLAAVLT